MQEQIITWGGALLLLLGALVIIWPVFRCARERREMEQRIAAVGVDQVRHVLLEDGMGGQSYYERLLLSPKGIMVLLVNSRDGIIFGGERMDTWAQVLGKRTIRFANPLYTLEALLATLRYHQPKIPLEGYVLFCGNSSFPKGRPPGVWSLDDLTAAGLGGVQESIQPVLKEAWDNLRKRARRLDPAKEGYLLPVEQSPAYLRGGVSALFAVAAVGWLLWRLI